MVYSWNYSLISLVTIWLQILIFHYLPYTKKRYDELFYKPRHQLAFSRDSSLWEYKQSSQQECDITLSVCKFSIARGHSSSFEDIPCKTNRKGTSIVRKRAYVSMYGGSNIGGNWLQCTTCLTFPTSTTLGWKVFFKAIQIVRSDLKRPYSRYRPSLHELKVRKNRQQKTCNLFCNIAAKRVE